MAKTLGIQTLALVKKLMEKQKAMLNARLVSSVNYNEEESLCKKIYIIENSIDEICREFDIIDKRGEISMATGQRGNTVKFDISIETLGLAKVLMEKEKAELEKMFANDDETVCDSICKIERIEKALDEINQAFFMTEL